MAHPAHLNNFPDHTGLNMNTQYKPNHNRNHNAYATTNAAASLSAQASLQTSLNALNSKIVQAQSLALLNNITVDEVLSRMGGLNEMELGLLRLCAAREQEARLQASLMSQQQQQMAILQQQQQQQKQQATTRNPSNRLSFPGMPSNRQPATDASWEESFGNLSLGGPDVVRTPTPKSANSTSASAQTQVTPPKVDKRTSPTSATSTAGLAAGKHEQAATWRRGSPSASQQTSISPAATPVRGISANAGAEPANKAFNFNGVFGNKVVGLPRQASQTSSVESSTTTNAKADGEGRKERVRTGRSGSASSSEGFESGSGSGSVLSDQQQQYQQERQDRLERSFVGRARESTFAGSTSSSSFESVGTPPPVLITPPCEPLENQYSGKQGSDTPNNGGYFGIKRVVSGEQGNGNVNVNGNGKYGPGVIGQGFGSPSTVLFPGGVGSTAYGVVIRQPHGPPGGADELGNKNFASRLRQKAVNDLGLLGRRRANSPNPHAVAA